MAFYYTNENAELVANVFIGNPIALNTFIGLMSITFACGLVLLSL